jgi:hypothetical protein
MLDQWSWQVVNGRQEDEAVVVASFRLGENEGSTMLVMGDACWSSGYRRME